MRFCRLPILVALVTTLAACQSATTQATDPTAPSPQQAQQLDRTLLDAAAGSEDKQDYIAAAAYYRALYNRDADDIDAIVGLSRSLRKLGKPVEAQAIVRRGLAKAPREAVLLAEMGKLQLTLGAPADAIESLSRAAALGHERWDLFSALVIAYDRVGMYEQASRRYEQALELAPENAVVLNNYALSRGQNGDLQKAVDLLERAIALPEVTPRMRQNLALFYALRGDMRAAEALVRRDMATADAENNLVYLRGLRHSMKGAGASDRDGAMRPEPARPAVPMLARREAPPAPPADPVRKEAAAPQPPALPVQAVTAAPADPAPAAGESTDVEPVLPAIQHRHADEFQITAQASDAPGGYWLHLGRFGSRAQALYHLTVLRGHEGTLLDGTQLAIVANEDDGIGVVQSYEVVTGTLPDRATAAGLCAELQARQSNCAIRLGPD